MAIKSSTAKMLAFLYCPTVSNATERQRDTSKTYTQLSYLLPELTPAGRRSLVAHGVKQGWVRTESQGETRIMLTEIGRTLCTQHFPAFQPDSALWCLCILVKPPRSDVQFRFLRALLLKEGAVSITRAVYLVPKEVFQSRLAGELVTSYRKSVIVLETSQWLFGDEREQIFTAFSLLDISEITSGISKELDGLLKLKIPFSDLSDKQKQYVFSVFSRLYSLIYKQMGVFSHFFPKSESFSDLWLKFQECPFWV